MTSFVLIDLETKAYHVDKNLSGWLTRGIF